MNIIEVDPEHYQSPVHVTSIPDAGAVSARSFSFHEMSPLQKREELKRLLLAMRDSTSNSAPGVAVTANASSFIPETMRAIHEFAQTVPDLDEQHEWDALFGLHAKDALLAVPKLAAVALEEHRASHRADAADTLDRRHGGFAAPDADALQPRETRTLAAPAQQPDASSPAAALWVMQEESDLAQAEGPDSSGGAIVELRQPPVPAHQPDALSGGSDGLRRGDDGSLVRDRLHSMIIAGAEPTAATAATLGRLSIDSMAAAIDDILASPPLTPRRRLSKTLLAEIHSSWEEIVGSNSSNSSSSNASQSNSPSSNGWRVMLEATADDLHQSSRPPMHSGAMDAERGERAANSDMTLDFSYWDDGANAIDLLLKPDDDGSSAAETAGHSRPLLPRCPLEFVPSKSKPPASSGPRTSAHSPKMAAAHPTTRVSLRPTRHRPSSDPAGVHRADPAGQEIDEDLQNREAFLSEANLSTPEPSIHTAHESAGVALMHSMAEEILSRPSSRTYTSRLGSRRSARSPRSQVARSQSASTEDSQLKTVTSAAEAGGEILKWKRGNVLGKGAFATVYCGLTSDGQLIAVKQIELNTDDWDKAEREYESVQEEVDLLKALKHRNIVGFLGTSLEDHVVNIFMQFIPGGTLSSLLSRFGAFEEQIFCRYTRQIVDGISYLHSNNVIHRDIKGANIMLMSNGVIKLIDFGCAKRLCVNLSLSASQLQRSMKGTPYWMAPEVVKETGHGKKSDIWSIGCTVFEMATTRPPWAEMQPMAAIFAIGSDRPVPQLPDTFSSLAREFVSACMTRDQSSRLDAAALLAHPFIITHTSVKK